MARTISPNEHVAASIHEGGVVLLHTTSGRIFTSNQIGGMIWRHLECCHALDEIATDISDHYRIPYEAAWSDTAQFISELERNRLIRRECKP
jgi:hypothetical protein